MQATRQMQDLMMQRLGSPVIALAQPSFNQSVLDEDGAVRVGTAGNGSADRELGSIMKYKIEGKPPSFGNRDGEDVDEFWRDWRRFLGNHHAGKGLSARDQLELLRTYLEGAVKKDYLNIFDAREPIEEEEYGFDFGDVRGKLAAGGHPGLLVLY